MKPRIYRRFPAQLELQKHDRSPQYWVILRQDNTHRCWVVRKTDDEQEAIAALVAAQEEFNT